MKPEELRKHFLIQGNRTEELALVEIAVQLAILNAKLNAGGSPEVPICIGLCSTNDDVRVRIVD